MCQLILKRIMQFCRILISLIVVSLWSSAGLAAESETSLPEGRFAIAGYGDVTYQSDKSGNTSNFMASFDPIFLFRLNDKLHVEAEVELSLNEEGSTEPELEYTDIHYFLTDTLTFTAGKFLLPFGQFSQNLHPSWINRTPWTPGIYGSHDGKQAMTPLLPVLSDVGISLQKTFVLNSRQKLFIDFFVTNGARAETAHEESTEGEPSLDELTEEYPEVEFEAASADNNKDKAFGGRVAYAFLPDIEVGASYYKASYDDTSLLDITAKGLDLNYAAPHFLLRGEYIETVTDGLEEEDIGTFRIHDFKRSGWYLQGIAHLGSFFEPLKGVEFVLEKAETRKFEEADRWVYGLNYWLDPRSVVKIAYQNTTFRNGEDDKRLGIQLSYGF